MVLNMLLTSEVIDDQVPALFARQSPVRRLATQRWLRVIGAWIERPRQRHVLAELELLRGVVKTGDYVVVEDGNVNGNPVCPDRGEGPKEAVDAYFERYPDDYRLDLERESKFGFIFAPSGFLIKN